MADNTSAAHSVFHTPELLSLILSHLSFSSLLQATLISTQFRTTILTTPSLQRTLFLLSELPSSLSALSPTSKTEVKLNPYLHSAFPARYPGLMALTEGPTPFFECQSQNIARRFRLELGPKTDFPFLKESRSWRNMLVLHGGAGVQIKELSVREKVDVRSYWRSNECWIGRWVRDRVLIFEDGMRCGDFWDLGKRVDDHELGGVMGDAGRIVRLVCRPKVEREVRHRVVGLVLDIKPDKWERVSWGAWFWCLFASKMDWKRSTWEQCLWVLIGGGRKKVGDKVVREPGRLVCENYLTHMEDEDFVLDIVIKPQESRWESWKFWSWWEQKIKVRRLEELGFVREEDKKPGECPHW